MAVSKAGNDLGSKRSRKVESKKQKSTKRKNPEINTALGTRMKSMNWVLDKLAKDSGWTKDPSSTQGVLSWSLTEVILGAKVASALSACVVRVEVDHLNSCCKFTRGESVLCRKRVEFEHLKRIFVEPSVEVFVKKFKNEADEDEVDEEDSDVEGDVDGMEELLAEMSTKPTVKEVVNDLSAMMGRKKT